MTASSNRLWDGRIVGSRSQGLSSRRSFFALFPFSSAFGYWFEDGAILHPVSEITLAGTLDEIYKNIVDRGSDLEIRSSINSPSLLVDGLRIAGD